MPSKAFVEIFKALLDEVELEDGGKLSDMIELGSPGSGEPPKPPLEECWLHLVVWAYTKTYANARVMLAFYNLLNCVSLRSLLGDEGLSIILSLDYVLRAATPSALLQQLPLSINS